MKKEYLIIFILGLIWVSWWTRFDVYCETRTSCVAYDRFTSTWVKPLEKSNVQSKVNLIKNIVKQENIGNFNIEKALISGYTTDEIIEHLNKE